MMTSSPLDMEMPSYPQVYQEQQGGKIYEQNVKVDALFFITLKI